MLKSSRKAFIVEDEILIAMNLKLIMEELGFNSVIVNNGPDAIQEAKNITPELILMDISLKGSLSGIDTAAALSSMNIPIIFITAYQNKETLFRAKIAEDHGFLIKPVFKEELQSEINRVLQQN